MNSLKIKNTEYKVKDMDMAQGRVLLYASSFGNMDSDGDIMEFGAYAKTITENGPSGKNRIKMLWQHDSWCPIGKPLSMTETAEGLLIESYVSDIKNSDYRKLYEQGIITEHSVGFIPIKEEQDRERGVNYIKEVKLFEYSAVTWGANEKTPVVGMKSMNAVEKADYLVKRLDTLSKALNKGTFTDDTFIQIQIAYEQLKAEVKDALSIKQPLDSTGYGEPQTPDLIKMFESQFINY